MNEAKTGEQKPVPADKVGKSKKVFVTFRENRKFDLHVGREMETFRGRETRAIPIAWLSHPDFLQQKRYFIVKGV